MKQWCRHGPVLDEVCPVGDDEGGEDGLGPRVAPRHVRPHAGDRQPENVVKLLPVHRSLQHLSVLSLKNIYYHTTAEIMLCLGSYLLSMCCDEDYQELSSQVTIIIIQSNKLSTLVIALCMLNNPLWLHSAKQPNTIHCPRCCHREEGSQLPCKARGSGKDWLGYIRS